MTQLAVRNGGNGALVVPPGVPAASSAMMTLNEVWQMAEYVAESGLFAVKTPQQAFTLMMLAQSEGLHAIQALKRYHIVEGRPSMRSDAMQAEFQARGGVIKIIRSDAVEARAIFSHPVLQPDGFEFVVTYEQFQKSGWVQGKEGIKANWKHSPTDMLWARLVTKAIRKIYPGIVAGIYSTEEVQDIIEAESPSAQISEAKEQARSAVASADEPVPGHDPREPDTRPYYLMVEAAVKATNDLVSENWGTLPDAPVAMSAKRLHGVLAQKSVNQGKADGPAPTKVQPAVALVSKVYTSDRQWLRSEVRQACQEHAEAAADALRAAMEAKAEAAELGAADLEELAGIEEAELGSGG